MKTIFQRRHFFLLVLSIIGLSYQTQAQIIINEVHADPASGIAGDANNDGTRNAAEDEFIELYNTSNSSVNISGWIVADSRGIRHIFRSGTTLPGQGTIVVFGGGNPKGDFGGSLIQTASTGTLAFSNGGDTARLFNANRQRVASLGYSRNQGSDNQSLTRRPDVTGSFTKHLFVSNKRYSPGLKIDGSIFTGNDNDNPGDNTPLKVVTWNVEWFGNTRNGPSPESTQKQRVKSIIQELDADVYALQEISSESLMAEVVDELPEYDWTFSTFASNPPNDPGVSQKVVFIYKKSRIRAIRAEALLTNLSPKYNGGDSSGISNYPTNPSQFWSSGRMPYMLTADVTSGDTTERIYIINIHAKAGSNNGPIRRAYDVETLKNYIDSNLATRNVILLGDYNDDVEDNNSSYDDYIFDNANSPGNDNQYYEILTRPLDLAGEGTFVGSSRFIDHIMVTDELTDNYIRGSVKVHNEVVTSDFTSRTSDHIPVSAQFNFSTNVSSALAERSTLDIKTASEQEDVLLFPNPSNDMINILVKNSKNNTPLNYAIYGTKGVIIQKGTIKPGIKNPINTASLSSQGIYILRLVGSDKVITKQIIRN